MRAKKDRSGLFGRQVGLTWEQEQRFNKVIYIFKKVTCFSFKAWFRLMIKTDLDFIIWYFGLYCIITTCITAQCVTSTSRVPIMTVLFIDVELQACCFVFLTPMVIMLRPWESLVDEEGLLLVWTHWFWSLSVSHSVSPPHYLSRCSSQCWAWPVGVVVSVGVCKSICTFCMWVGGRLQLCLASLISAREIRHREGPCAWRYTFENPLPFVCVCVCVCWRES